MSNPWNLPAVPQDIPHGDMPGDKICIGPDHVEKARAIYPRLREGASFSKRVSSRKTPFPRSRCTSG